MKKKLILLFLTICLMMTSLTACGERTDTGSNRGEISKNNNEGGSLDSQLEAENSGNMKNEEYTGENMDVEVIIPVAIPTSYVMTQEDSSSISTHSYYLDKDGDVVEYEVVSDYSSDRITEYYEYLLDEDGNKIKGFNDMYYFTYNLEDDLDLLATYRNESLLSKLSWKSNGITEFTYEYSYDENNRMTKEIYISDYDNNETVYHWNDNMLTWKGHVEADYTLDFYKNGLIKNRVCDAVIYDGTIYEAAYTYNMRNQLTSFLVKTTFRPGDADRVEENKWEFAYDIQGNLISCKNGDDFQTTYEYDSTGKLVKQNVQKFEWGEAVEYTRAYIYEQDKLMYIEVDGQKEWEFTYDENGRLTSIYYVAQVFEMGDRVEENLIVEMELSEIDRYVVKQMGQRLFNDLYAQENVTWSISY